MKIDTEFVLNTITDILDGWHIEDKWGRAVGTLFAQRERGSIWIRFDDADDDAKNFEFDLKEPAPKPELWAEVETPPFPASLRETHGEMMRGRVMYVGPTCVIVQDEAGNPITAITSHYSLGMYTPSIPGSWVPVPSPKEP